MNICRIALAVLIVANIGFPISASAKVGDQLDISKFHETFSENFRSKLDVSPWGPSKWIAHTPWHGDFGDAGFADPQTGFPFITGANGLNIIARKDINGKWKSGLLSSVDEKGRGFQQANGYFEARMKMPSGPGTWPAFWLVADGGPDYKSEIDIIEYYGRDPANYHITAHLWPKDKSQKPPAQAAIIPVPPGSLESDFHTFGVDITDNEEVFYLDRKEVRRMSDSPPMHYPMSLLVNLALGSGWPIDKTPDPSVLNVDYIKVFARNNSKSPQSTE